jgi:heptosyltransferase-2
MKLMVRATNWVGDAVMSLPAVAALRRQRPKDEIVLVARPWVADLYKALGIGDGVMIQDPKRGRGALAAELREARFDAALLLPNSFDAAWIAWRAGIPERWGYARDARSPLLTKAVRVPRAGEIPEHQAYYYLELLRQLGILTTLPAVEDFRLPTNAVAGQVARQAARDRLGARESGGGLRLDGVRGAAGPIVGLNPGAAFGTAKRWMPERYIELGRRLRDERGAAIVLFGSAAERDLAASIASRIGAGAISTAGETTLGGFLELAAGCDLFVTNDTGTMHVAAAAGIAVLALFGSTDDQATAPLGPRVRLLKHAVSCSPCLLRHCPVDHRCMRVISVNEVFETSCQILDAVPPSFSTGTAR